MDHRAYSPVERKAVFRRECDGRLGLSFVGPGQQHGPSGFTQQLAHNGGALLGGLAWPVDGFGHALSERPVVVHPGEAQIGEGKAPQASYGVVRSECAGADVVEKLAQSGLVHRAIIP